jgi:hypothetical protein
VSKNNRTVFSWGNLPVPPDPLHWSAHADTRLRRDIEIKL